MAFTLEDFVRESNRIEGILCEPTEDEIAVSYWVCRQPKITIDTLRHFLGSVQPDARLRSHAGLNVRVGSHVAPSGGLHIVEGLNHLLVVVNGTNAKRSAYGIHYQYETLHPFTDGNGRSGRIIWLKMMGGIEAVPLGFLHTWYYQSLQERRA